MWLSPQAIQASGSSYDSYSVAPAFNEDVRTETPAVIKPVDHMPGIRATLAVFFTLMGGVILAASVYCLIRRYINISTTILCTTIHHLQVPFLECKSSCRMGYTQNIHFDICNIIYQFVHPRSYISYHHQGLLVIRVLLIHSII